MKKIYYFLTILLILSGIGTYAQEQGPESYIRDIVPPAPNAAGLGKYGEIPVSLATGVPNVSIPIGELKQGDLSVPIQLSYHASGIKVEEIASWVGLGWSLDAGGVITRTVRGLPDEEADYGYFDYYKYVDTTFVNSYDSLELVRKRLRDVEPDRFYFNFLGYSGEIVITETMQIFLNPHQDVKIEILPGMKEGGSYAWVATLPNGTKCYFGESPEGLGATDTSLVMAETSSTDEVTAWYLAKVEAPNNADNITFEYQRNSVSYENAPSETMYELFEGEDGDCDMLPPHIVGTTTYAYQHALRKISTSNQTVTFTQDTTKRSDLEGGKRLQFISFLDKQGGVLKEYELIHSYFISETTLEKDYRLKLDEVKIRDKNGYYLLGFSLQYYSLVLPLRLSFKRDHWGYFNNNSKETAVPEKSKKPDGNWYIMSGGGSREPDPNKVNACMLKKITYPTGGSSTFSYEPHSYSYIGDKKVQLKVWKEAKAEAIPTTIEGASDEYTFTVTEPYVTRVDAKVEAMFEFEPVGAYAKLTKVETDPNDNKVLVNIYTTDCESSCSKTYSKEIALEAGTYKLEAGAEYVSTDNKASAWIRADLVTGYEDGELHAGGARIKEIINDDGKTQSFKSYFYTGADTLSSGALVNEPAYYHILTNLEEHSTLTGNIYCSNHAVTASSKIQLGSSGGIHVSYSEIKVIENEGHTLHVFTSAKDYPDTVSRYFPFPPSVSERTLRAKPKSSLIYDQNNNLLNQQETTYNFDSGDTMAIVKDGRILEWGLVVGKLVNNVTTTAEENMENWYARKFYNKYIFNPLPVRTEKHFYSDGNPFSTSTSLEYDTENRHNQVVNKKEELGYKIIVTHFTYPFDKTEPVYQEMVKRNQIDAPVEIMKTSQSSRGEKVLLKHILHYVQKAGSGEPYLGKIEDQTELANGTSNSGDTLYENKLYESGRIWEEETLKEGKKAFLWSTDNNYIEAVAINATKDQLLYYGFEEDGNVIGDAKTGEKSFNGDKIINRPTVAGTYTLSYWKKENGEWIPYQKDFSASSITLSGSLDEIRVYPKDALMSTYTYKPGYGVTSITDANGQTTYYEYDDFQRLIRVRDESKNILQQHVYKYAAE